MRLNKIDDHLADYPSFFPVADVCSRLRVSKSFQYKAEKEVRLARRTRLSDGMLF